MVYKKSAGNKRKHVPASHFKVAEVTMRPLNDPLPLEQVEDHPRRPSPFLTSYNTVEQDLIDAGSVTTTLPSKPRSQISQQPNELTYPSVSNETRRLLKEVANVRKQYENKSVEEMATLLPCELVGGSGELSSKSWDKKQPLRSKKVRKIKRVAPVASSINTVTNSATIDEPVKSMGNKVTKKRFVAHVESVSFGLPPTTLQRDKSLSIHNESEILIEPKDNILKENEVMEDDNDEKITEECIVLKPWRANMKRQKTIDESNEIEVEPSPAKKDGKPWRANMKKSTEQTENEEPLADTPCHARQRPEDHEKVQKYMRIKRKKTINERKAKVEAAAQEKAAVQQRLQALETWRRSQANESVETEKELMNRLRKQEEAEYLKQILTQLTNEMRATYKQQPSSSIPQKEEVLSPSVLTPAAFESLSEKGLIQTTEVSTTPPQVVTKGQHERKEENLRDQVEIFRLKQTQMLQEIQSQHPDLIPKKVEENSNCNNKVTSEKNRKSPAVFSTSYARSHAWTESPKQSPKEEFYSSEIRMKPDAFNVMSTAHRKLWVEPETSEQPRDIDSPISERMMSLSEGPILSGSECSSQKSSSVKDKAMDEVLDEEPVRDTGAATTDTKRVPTALHLRFQAELQQMESIQEAERQLNHINQIKDVVNARSQAAIAANHAQALSEEVKKRSSTDAEEHRQKPRESRSQFESRMRRELQELFNSRMAELMKSQMAATQMTLDAANQLAQIQNKKKTSSATTMTSKRSSPAATATSAGGTRIVSEDIKSMISKTESNVPEILSAVEATDRSAKDIQKSIRSAIRELSREDEDDPSSNNITEDIAAELMTEDDISKKSTSGDESSMASNFFLRHLDDEKKRDKHQFSLLKKRQKILTEKAKSALAKVEKNKEIALKNKDEAQYQRFLAKEKKIKQTYREHKDELAGLKYALQVAERERSLLWHQRRTKMSYFKEDDTISTSTSVSYQMEDEKQGIHQSCGGQSSTSAGGATPNIKTKMPLSPKRTQLRKRHSSADSEESFSLMSQVETVSSAGDQSDLEIRVHALQDELGKRMKTAARLKKEQKLARRERLKVQEDALKKQIEVYDQLIEQTKADISSPPLPESNKKIVQPQIKTPKQQSLRSESDTSSPPLFPQHSISDDASSTETIVVSPHKGTPIDDVKETNYSDDFTSSSVKSPSPPPSSLPEAKPKLSEKTVDAICGHLLEAMIEDAVGRMKPTKPPAAVVAPSSPTTTVQIQEEKHEESPKTSKGQIGPMQTAFDISSESSEEEQQQKTDEQDEQIENNKEEPRTTNEEEVGDFIDDDFGLSIKREWEQLRLQQLRIEEEINNIQRETVPEPKPPPPYTPPVSPPAASTPDVVKSPRRPPPPKAEAPCYVPSGRDELNKLVSKISESILKHRHNLSLTNSEFQAILDDKNPKESSYQPFLRFVVDLVENVLLEMFRGSREQQNPPWMTQKALTKNSHAIPSDDKALIARVQKEILVAFGHEKRAQKENLIVRWSHKRRDRVDQVLVRELHAEESAWTNYEEDEVQVKDEICSQMLDVLVADTVKALHRVALNRRSQQQG